MKQCIKYFAYTTIIKNIYLYKNNLQIGKNKNKKNKNSNYGTPYYVNGFIKFYRANVVIHSIWFHNYTSF